MISMDKKQQILHYYRVDRLSLREISRRVSLDRKTVRRIVRGYEEAVAQDPETVVEDYLSMVPRYRGSSRPPRVLTDAVIKEIDRWLKENDRRSRNGMRKQCLKKKGIHRELASKGFKVSYPTICRYIRRKQESLMMAVFAFPFSKGRFAYLFHRQDTLAFMEAHRNFFRDVEGVPRTMVYDNMRVAVVFDNKEKRPTEALMRLSTFYRFGFRYCNARVGWEKGDVEQGAIGSRGMEYQWGRKDPLLPSLMSYEDCAVLGDYDYETNNCNVGDGTGKWDYALPMEHADKALGNACMAVLNPMSFIMTNFYVEPVKPYDWFCINPDAGAFLWGDDISMDKTIFDPCPAGYTVPSASAWTAGEAFEPGDFGITVSGIFWPFTGYRITYSGNHDGTDEYGYYWTCSMCPEEGSEGRSLYMQADASGMELPFEGRAMPMAVRCVKM